MTKIKQLQLPVQMPNISVMKSFNHNKHNYEPDFWEFEYDCIPYLNNNDNKYLQERYNSIIENMQIYNDPQRDCIPCSSFLSSWYWFKKEHQTRYALYRRGITIDDLSFGNHRHQSQGTRLNIGEKLYRYGDRQYMDKFIEGEIRISPASAYIAEDVGNPRFDNELVKERWDYGGNIRINTSDGKNLPIKGDMKTMVSASSYYTLCLSTQLDKYIFNKFSANSCVVIENTKEFEARVEKAISEKLPEWYFMASQVGYYDPKIKASEHELLEATICKDFSYAYQCEYRIVIDSMENDKAIDYINLDIGDMHDISRMVYI